MAIVHIDDAQLAAIIREQLAQLIYEARQAQSKQLQIEQTVTRLDPILDVKDVASYLKVSVFTVKNRLRSGELRGYKQGGYWRIKREWLLEYERSLTGESMQEGVQ